MSLGRDLNSCDDRRFRKEVNQTRNKLHKTPKTDLFSQDACSALTQAETVLEQTFESPTFSTTSQQCILLEVYANLILIVPSLSISRALDIMRFALPKMMVTCQL